MSNKIFLVGKDITELKEILVSTANEFTKNFKDLDTELTTLTSRGFTGDAATTLVNTYTSKVQPLLQNIANETSKAADDATDFEVGAIKAMSELENIASRY